MCSCIENASISLAERGWCSSWLIWQKEVVREIGHSVAYLSLCSSKILMGADKTVKVSVPVKRCVLIHKCIHHLCMHIHQHCTSNATVGFEEAKQYCKLWLALWQTHRYCMWTHSGWRQFLLILSPARKIDSIRRLQHAFEKWLLSLEDSTVIKNSWL